MKAKKGDKRSLREKLENNDEMRRKGRNPCLRNENLIIISYHLFLGREGDQNLKIISTIFRHSRQTGEMFTASLGLRRFARL